MNIRPGTSSIYTNASSLLASAAAECLTSPPVNRFCISVIFSTLNLDCASVVSDYKTCSHSLSHQHTHWLTSESRLRSEDTAVDLRLNKLAISDRNHAYTSNTPTMRRGFSSACMQQCNEHAVSKVLGALDPNTIGCKLLFFFEMLNGSEHCCRCMHKIRHAHIMTRPSFSTRHFVVCVRPASSSYFLERWLLKATNLSTARSRDVIR